MKEENHPNGYRSFTISTADNVSFNSVKVNDLEINQAGINAGSQRIAQVVDGINDTDVVNVRQLKRVKNYVEETAQEIRNVKGQLNQMNQELRAGIAGASALGMLQVSSGAGKSALSASLANYKGQSAVAVGYARSSDNNQVHIKLGAGINTASDVTLGGSVGLHW
ncbi:YadA-like family protein [Mannheimia sp. ZY171111]|uniref:YadA-like family protein n=1 Tax=Mannheimia sp. ZY171111 TaxID=2679995 RepID=UPI00352BF884